MVEFKLNSTTGVPIYRQIQDQIRFGIASGRLCPGEQLPTVRALAVELSVNPNTVTKAYNELERDGVVTSEQGTGTFVAATQQTPVSPAQRQEKLDSMCLGFLADAGALGFTAQEVAQAINALSERE